MIRCHSPFFTYQAAFPCGKCAACLSRRRRTWAGRILLEAEVHPGAATFSTLTYARDVPSLNIRDVQLFLKKLRRKNKLRVFYCGEYGDTTQRPHYHAVLYGLPNCPGGPIATVGKQSFCGCSTCTTIRETWDLGYTVTGNLTQKRAMYIAGYVVKKMTHRLDPRLHGREPEFARMSLRPGIGALSLRHLVHQVARFQRTIPGGIEFGGRQLPLGRYLRKKIAGELGQDNEAHSQAYLGTQEHAAKMAAAMQTLRAYAWAVEKPVEKVWEEVLEITEEKKVIPDFPVIHRPISEEVRNV